jgi:hypothetical protein
LQGFGRRPIAGCAEIGEWLLAKGAGPGRPGPLSSPTPGHEKFEYSQDTQHCTDDFDSNQPVHGAS